MDLLRELSYQQCLELLSESAVGRVAFCTPTGPTVIPVNYVVDDDSIVFRTTPYGIIGTYGTATKVAFEIDGVDEDNHTGWSVLATGSAERIDNSFDVARFLANGGPRPWAAGTRLLFVRLRWQELTGRRVGRAAVQ